METQVGERAPQHPTGDTTAVGRSTNGAPEELAEQPGAGDGGASPVPDEPQVQVRRVRRILRRVDPWSVLKLSFIFFACMYGVIVVSSLLLWRAAVSSGIVDDVEEFVVELGFDTFEFLPDQMFRALLFGGAGMIVILTFLAVLTTVLFNLISDLVGGIRISMIEQQILENEQH